MNHQPQISRIRLYPLSIPLRREFKHAAHTRHTADPIVVQVELADGTLGHGETLPRAYVTGETIESVIDTIRHAFVDELVAYKPESFPDALERIDALPMYDESGAVIAAARAGVELALLDAYSRLFHRPISEAVGWLGLAGQGAPGSLERVRFSGVLSGENPDRLAWSVRKMRWFGLRDFKLKVGYPDDLRRVRIVAETLGRSLGRKTTLRLDANGVWSPAQALTALQALKEWPVACIEQPMARESDSHLSDLKAATRSHFMHDESLVTHEDAQRLLEAGVADAFNIRISKNGGFLASLRLAHFARKNEVACQLGCLVGETSILSAVGRHFVQSVPGLLYAEGSYGRFLLRGDVIRRPLTFGYGGRVRPMSGLGWGVSVDPGRLAQYAQHGVIEIGL